MSRVSLLLFRQGEEIPVLDWLLNLDDTPQRRIQARLELLAEQGHAARRPLVENLGEGIYELRTRVGRVNYRVLFSFHGRNAVLLSHGFTKEREIPAADLARARERKAAFEANPSDHFAELDL